MRALTLILLVLATAAFVVASATLALHPAPSPAGVLGFAGLKATGATPFATLIRPANLGLQALLLAVWGAAVLHALRAGRRLIVARQASGIGPAAPDPTPAADLTLSLALAAGAAWAVTLRQPTQLPGLLAVGVMAGAAIVAALLRQRDRLRGVPAGGTVEVFAGWATAAFFLCLASVLVTRAGLSPALAGIIAVLLLMLTAVEVQLRLGGAATYGATIIIAMIAVAAASIGSNATIAMAAIVAITALVAVLVRVLS